jgi:hypothetical protein
MQLITHSLAWTGALLAVGSADLWTPTLSGGDLLLIGLGAAPVAAFGIVALAKQG